jgi:hypothetical protein
MNALMLEHYFTQPDTPAAGSPIGKLMVRILGKNPAMKFEEARQAAHRMQERAAGKTKYQLGPVQSPEEKAESLKRFRAKVIQFPGAVKIAA